MSTTQYRWNAQQAAADYDQAAPVIHPLYDEVQQAVLGSLPFSPTDAPHVIDLGGGSGRLAERVLESFPRATVTVVDQSEAFLGLARERLKRFGPRFDLRVQRAQDDWRSVAGSPDAIVSTSALHHLDGGEKSALFAECRDALAATHGVFINGDEYRPPSDATYRDYLEEWGQHMRSSVAAGLIPDTFGEVVDRWEERNLAGFGGPRASGDDCHETVEEQIARLYGAGFRDARVAWGERLWAVLVAQF